MSRTVDERVVEMRFDNKQFENNVQTSMSTIQKLKQCLNLEGASKGLENLGTAAKRCDMSGLVGAADTVRMKFSAMNVMAVTAIANITNSAVTAGKRIVSALTIDPVKTGFQEYETQINAIQTILANTESKGSTLQDVNAALDELNHYADLTIYNFTEMTRNIGTFTAAGVDLETSVSAIKGIANLAAVSGSTSQQASTAMYQLSQALAAGTVKLQDWNSVVNAGMGGQVFQDALKETARVHDIAIDSMIEKEGSFRETLSQGWLTSEILTETLSKFTGDLSEAQLQQMGYTEEQIKSIVKMGQTANDAATKVKTLSQLWDTLQEAAQSGWTKTWQLIVGDFDEAKELLTGVSDTVSEFINASSDRRNNLLEGALLSNWGKLTNKINEAGIETQAFEDKLKEMVNAHGRNADKLIEKYGSLKNAFKEGAISTVVLKDALNKLQTQFVDLSNVRENLQRGDAGDDVKKIQELLQGLDLDIGETGVDGILGSDTEAAIRAFQELHGLSVDGIVGEETFKALEEACGTTNKLSDEIFEMVDSVTELGGREKLIESFKNIFKVLDDTIKPVKEALAEVFPPATSEQLGNVIDKFHAFTENLKVSDETAGKIKRTFKGVFSAVDLLKKGISAILSPIGEFIGSGGLNGIGNALMNIVASIGDFFTSLDESTGVGAFFASLSDGIFNLFRDMGSIIDPALEKVESFGDIFTYVKNVICSSADSIFGVIKDVFTWITNNVSAGDIFAGLAGGGIFTASKKFSKLLTTIRESVEGVFGTKSDNIKNKFSDVLGGIKDSLASFTSGIKVASLLGISAAVLILSVALKTISKLESAKIADSLMAIGAMLGELSGTLFVITKVLSQEGSKGLIKAGASLILIAEAVKILADAMIKVSDLSWEEIGKGLAALGGALLELSVALKIINEVKISISTSIAMLALAEACKILGDALGKFSGFSREEIGRGLTAMGGALAEIIIALSALSKVGGFGSLLGATGVLIAVQSLDEISESLKSLGALSWEEIGRGLAAMGGALGEFTIALGVLSKVGGFGSLLGAVGILIAAQALKPVVNALSEISKLSWEEIGKGLAGMGGALTELAVVSGVLGKTAGFSGILGSASILIGVQGLGDLADALGQFGSMTFDEITTGLVGMGGSLTELAVVSGLLGNLGGLGAVVGSGSLLLATQGLGDIADALKKFGEMEWDEIGRGLAAMGGALGETALGGLLNTFSGFGAGAIATVAGPLGDLADSVSNWTDVTVPEGLGTQLGELGDGIQAFNFSGWGATAIKTLGTSLGDLADSIVRWTGVTVPDGIDTQLGTLADGIKKFNFTGWGSSSIKTLAGPIGDLSDSIIKWSDVSIDDNMETILTGLANGMTAWSYMDVSNLPTIMDAMDGVPDTMKLWNDVSISENLGGSIEALADGLTAYNDIDGDHISTVCDSISSIGTAAADISDIDFDGISSKLETFASAISGVSISTDAFTNLGATVVDKFTSAIDSGTGNMSGVGTSLIDTIASGMTSNMASVSSAITSVTDSATAGIEDKKDEFVSAGSYLISGFLTGIRDKLSDISAIGRAISLTCISAAREYYDIFQNTGEYLVSGFVNGIRSKINNAATAAADMASAAISAATSALNEQSPSKVFYHIGEFAGLGFVNALTDYKQASYEAGASIADSAREGLNKTITRINDTVTNNIDTTPTIRPVLDLSGVEAGAGRIRGIIGAGGAIGVTENIRAINSMMGNRQNGASNDEVISAIDRLQKTIGKSSGDSYVINGITYDDGSNISNAMKAIVRAARMERRG